MKRLQRLLVNSAAVLLIFGGTGVLIAATASADESQAKTVFKGMSDYLAAQKSMSFNFDSNLEVVTMEGQRIGLASSGAVEVSRPDKIRATRTGGFADVELVFDGKTLSLLGKNLNLYTQAEMPGSIDHLVDELRDKYQRPLPAADLLMSDAYGQIMPMVTDVKDLGTGVIRGQECDHVAMRAKDVDLQIWIATGKEPYPCRYTITSRDVEGGPQYTIDVRDWKASPETGSGDFTFTPPKDAKSVKVSELTDVDELPSEFAPKK